MRRKMGACLALLPLLLSLHLLVSVAAGVLAQEHLYTLGWHVVAGGGGAFSRGDHYALGGTAGQAGAGVLNGGEYTLGAGFWSAGMRAPADEPDLLHYTFDEGLQGWSTGHLNGEYDAAEWSDDNGNPPGSVRLDGSDLGDPDGEPNSWMSRTITLPANFNLLYFETRATVDGALRVRLVDGSGESHTLLDWEVLEGESWRERTADIAPYAGQTVTLYFEQGDNDVGVGEHRYVDNVILCEQAAPAPSAGSGTASATCVEEATGDHVTYLPAVWR